MHQNKNYTFIKKGYSMTKEQIQTEINKTNRKLANVQAEMRKQKRSIEDNGKN